MYNYPVFTNRAAFRAPMMGGTGLAATKEKKIMELVGRLKGEFDEPLQELLRDGVVSKKEFERLFELITHVFDELIGEIPNTKRMDRKLREFILGVSDLNYESEINDETLRQATKLIREKIVGRSQKESLARLISEEMVESWTSIDRARIEKIAGDGGLIEHIQEKIEGGLDFGDGELIGLITEFGGIVFGRYMERLSDEDLDGLLEQSAAIVRAIETKEKMGGRLLDHTKTAMQKLGLIALMRRAFTGLLLGDLILRQVGRSLGIKDSMTVTDFIIFVGVKVFEAEGIGKADAAQTRRVREAIDAAGKIK